MRYILVAGMLFWLVGCAHQGNPSSRLTETQEPLVTGCRLLGVISESADDDLISIYVARRVMLRKVRDRAVQLGASHLVWLHDTDYTAAAKAYHCPGRNP